MKKFLIGLLIVVCILTAIYKFTAPKEIVITGTIPFRTEQELILKSDLIIEGNVEEIGNGKWSNPDFKEQGKRNILQTDITVKINSVLSGEYSSEKVVVRIDKGYDPASNTKVISDGYPDFKAGEEIVLFLSRDDSDVATDENYFVLTGMKQGKWNLSGNKITSADYESQEISQTLEELKEKIKVMK